MSVVISETMMVKKCRLVTVYPLNWHSCIYFANFLFKWVDNI